MWLQLYSVTTREWTLPQMMSDHLTPKVSEREYPLMLMLMRMRMMLYQMLVLRVRLLHRALLLRLQISACPLLRWAGGRVMRPYRMVR